MQLAAACQLSFCLDKFLANWQNKHKHLFSTEVPLNVLNELIYIFFLAINNVSTYTAVTPPSHPYVLFEHPIQMYSVFTVIITSTLLGTL